MRRVLQEYEASIEVKQSKFIAYLLPYREFVRRLQALREQHPKARHFVSAYRFLNEYDQIVEASSDDKEPRGTAGKPLLHVLQGSDLIDTAAIVVRYFGGIKLGTGGLVRAYSQALQAAIENANLEPFTQHMTTTICFSYTLSRQIEYELQRAGISILEKRYEDRVCFVIEAPQENIERFLSTFDGITHIPHR